MRGKPDEANRLECVEVCGNDEPFLFELYAQTRMNEVASWGWPAEQVSSFLRMQYAMRRQSYAAQYPDAEHRLVVVGGEKAGHILTAVRSGEIVLVDLALMPEFRNRGLGTRLITELQRRAAADGRAVVLQVLAGNPAERLYARLGFKIVGEHYPYRTMKWTLASEEAFGHE